VKGKIEVADGRHGLGKIDRILSVKMYGRRERSAFSHPAEMDVSTMRDSMEPASRVTQP